VLSFAHEPALSRFTACCAGCSFSNGTRKTNAAFGVACFSFVLSFAHEPALSRFTACYAGCSFANGTRKTNAAFGVACFSFVLIISYFPCDDTAEKGAACLFRCTQRLSFD